MSLNRQTLAKIDRRLLSQLDHEDGVQLVKVPVSVAVWSTWRRYCEAVGISMGRALALLLQRELSSIADDEIEGRATLLQEREMRVSEMEASLTKREEALVAKEKRIAVLERNLADRSATSTAARAPLPAQQKLGRNEQCWCGSKKKFKYCHGRSP